MTDESPEKWRVLQSVRERHECFCKGFDRLFQIDRDSDDTGGAHYDATRNEFLLPLLGLCLYALPAALATLAKIGTESTQTNREQTTVVADLIRVLIDLFTGHSLLITSLVTFVPLVGGIAVFLCNAARSGSQDTSSNRWPPVETLDFEFDDEIRETLLTEYVTLAEEARYRDKLLLQTGYFSLAGFAALMAVFVEFDEIAYKAGIPMVGSLLSLAFAIAVNSYKDARDPLWERMRRIELHSEVEGVLTSFHTIRTEGDRRLFDHLSLSGYIMNLQLFFLLIWVVLYFVTVVFALLQLNP